MKYVSLKCLNDQRSITYLCLIFFIIAVSNFFSFCFGNATTVNPPTQGNGCQIYNRFANCGEYFNKLTWVASSSLNIVYYRVYKDGIATALVPPSKTIYEEHNQPHTSVIYAITALDDEDNESTPLYIEVHAL